MSTVPVWGVGLIEDAMGGGGQNPERVTWLFVAIFLLLGVLLVVQITRWLNRRSPRTRSFQLVAQAAGDTVFEIDLLSRRVWCTNPKGLGIHGIQTHDDLQIGTDYDRVHPDDREELRRGWDRLARGADLNVHIRLREAGDGWAWVHANAVAGRGRWPRKARAYGVIRHSNSLHERQANLAEARRLESVGTIAGGVAHEFNNHLTPVRGYLELALEDLPAGTTTYEGLGTALAQVLRCSELVSQIQAYGRKSMMILKPVDLTELLPGIRDRVRELGMGTGAKTIHLVEDWPDHLPAVNVDPAQFRKALDHLIGNAAEAMPNGGELRVEADVLQIQETDCYGNREATPGERVMIRVVDAGIGIREEFLSQVMDPFFTTHGRASAQGMGLPMVQGMMAQLGGWMTVRSTEGLGTTIELFVPVASNRQADSGSKTGDAAALEPHATVATGRMLIADDEPFVRELARKVFEGNHWFVEEACDFGQVIDRCTDLDQPELDMVLMDLMMPGPPAEDALRAARSVTPGIRILIMSGFSRDARVDAMIRQTDGDFIGKPFSMTDLTEKVHSMMSVSRATGTRP